MRRAGLAGLAGLALGCGIPDLDLSGKRCPCVSGYTCDESTQRCVAAGSDDGGVTPPGCLGTSTLNTPAFSEGFDTDFSGWTTGGTGSWSVSNGEAAQTQAGASLAYAYPTTLVNLASYRVVSTLRPLPGGAMNGRVGLGIRQQASLESLSCSWEPNLGELHVRHTSNTGGDDAVGIGQAVNIDPAATVTMETEIAGTQLRCCLLEAPTVVLEAGPVTGGGGPPTLWSRALGGAWTDFHVFTQ